MMEEDIVVMPVIALIAKAKALNRKIDLR